MLHVVEITPDIADRLEDDANWRDGGGLIEKEGNPELMREAAALIRDLDKAISHAIAVHGSLGLSPWATSVLHDAFTRRLRRGGS